MSEPIDDPPPPEDIDEMIAQARDLMFATDLAASWTDADVLPEALATYVTLTRQMAENMRVVAATARRHPDLLERLPTLLDQWASALDLIAPSRDGA